MATLAQLRAAFGSAWHTNAEGIYDLLASDGTAGAGVAGVFGNLTATGNVALGDAITDTFSVYGKTPIAQPANAGQAIFTAQTLTAIATTVFSAAFTGMWAFSSSTVAKSYRTQINKLIVDSAKQSTLLLRIRLDLVNLGFIKGAA